MPIKENEKAKAIDEKEAALAVPITVGDPVFSDPNQGVGGAWIVGEDGYRHRVEDAERRQENPEAPIVTVERALGDGVAEVAKATPETPAEQVEAAQDEEASKK